QERLQGGQLTGEVQTVPEGLERLVADLLRGGPEEGEHSLAGIEFRREEVPDVPAVQPRELGQLQAGDGSISELDLRDGRPGEAEMARCVLLPEAGGFAGFPETAGEIFWGRGHGILLQGRMLAFRT